MKDLGKCISKEFFFVKPTKIFSAAYSGDFMKGIGNLFLSVSGVFINPGLIKDTLTFFLLKSKYKLSAKLISAALEAQYPEAAGRPLYPATEETKEMYFCGCKMTGHPPFCDGTHSKP